MSAKDDIIEIFREKVKGKVPDTTGKNEHHDGRQGHWLEHQFGVVANADNRPDLWGYELKNETTSKKTFGDWSANQYIFTDPEYSVYFTGRTRLEKRDSFLQIFGKPNEAKEGRCSWSGSPCPKISGYNDFGQILIIDENKDIKALYSYDKDKRQDKKNIVPKELQIENLVIAHWYGFLSQTEIKSSKYLKTKVEKKFNDKGWFTCKTDSNGAYCKICFGKPMNYDNWLELVKDGTVIFDSGMKQRESRPYSMWRANNNYWNSLIIEEYE